ncbi:MAG: PA14 domain-containing protein, partial [bacterium]
EGAVKVPETGKYRFEFKTNGKAVIHLHEGLLFDADGGYDTGKTIAKELFLEEGYHPIKIVCKNGETSDYNIDLKWSGPGFIMRSLEREDLYHF